MYFLTPIFYLLFLKILSFNVSLLGIEQKLIFKYLFYHIIACLLKNKN